MGSRVSDILERAAPGRALTVFCEDVRAARPELRAATEEQDRVPTLVALEWDRAPALAAELDEIRDALARAAVSTWPDWYLTAEQRFERKRPETVADVIAELRGTQSKASVAWLKRAWQRASKGQLPLVPPLTSAEQVRQLSRALDPQSLIFVLSVELAEASDARVRGVARAAEWLAHESQAKVILLLPSSWQSHQELDHATYQSLVWPTEPAPPPPEPPRGSNSRIKAKEPEPPAVLVGPVVGKPHPGSTVEVMLHALLTAAPDLCALFEFNQFITVFGEKRIKPDVIWRDGGLVIEVDGDEHCRPPKYFEDRDRDYRLYMSGYITLRLTNPEVYQNPDSVLEKIRNVVNRLKRPEPRTAHGLPT